MASLKECKVDKPIVCFRDLANTPFSQAVKKSILLTIKTNHEVSFF